MSIELKLLLYATILLLLQMILQASAGIIQNGMGWALGARDDGEAAVGYAGRFERAFYNMLETFPIFAVLALMVQMSESWNTTTALGAQLYFWGRVIYVPVYVSGVPILRTVVWAVSIIGMCLMAWSLTRLVVG